MEPVAHDGNGVFVIGLAVHLHGGLFQELRQLSIGTRSMNVSLDDSDAKAVLFAVPLGQLCRRGRFSLTVEPHEKQGSASGLEGCGWAENPHQFGVQDVHGVGLHRQARSRFLLSHPCFETVNDFLGLANVEICFLKGTSEASRHLTEFFFVEFTLVLEQAQRAEDSPRQAFKSHVWP